MLNEINVSVTELCTRGHSMPCTELDTHEARPSSSYSVAISGACKLWSQSRSRLRSPLQSRMLPPKFHSGDYTKPRGRELTRARCGRRIVLSALWDKPGRRSAIMGFEVLGPQKGRDRQRKGRRSLQVATGCGRAAKTPNREKPRPPGAPVRGDDPRGAWQTAAIGQARRKTQRGAPPTRRTGRCIGPPRAAVFVEICQ
jgi:hypothetical protein